LVCFFRIFLWDESKRDKRPHYPKQIPYLKSSNGNKTTVTDCVMRLRRKSAVSFRRFVSICLPNISRNRFKLHWIIPIYPPHCLVSNTRTISACLLTLSKTSMSPKAASENMPMFAYCWDLLLVIVNDWRIWNQKEVDGNRLYPGLIGESNWSRQLIGIAKVAMHLTAYESKFSKN
jgi:hypothetical protein